MIKVKIFLAFEICSPDSFETLRYIEMVLKSHHSNVDLSSCISLSISFSICLFLILELQNLRIRDSDSERRLSNGRCPLCPKWWSLDKEDHNLWITELELHEALWSTDTLVVSMQILGSRTRKNHLAIVKAANAEHS